MSQLSSNTWPPKFSNWLETPRRILKSSVLHHDICSSPFVVMKNSTLWFAPLSLLVVSYLVSTVRCCSRLNKRRRQRRMPRCFLFFPFNRYFFFRPLKIHYESARGAAVLLNTLIHRHDKRWDIGSSLVLLVSSPLWPLFLVYYPWVRFLMFLLFLNLRFLMWYLLLIAGGGVT